MIRAGLVSVLAARVDGHLLDPRIAYITSDSRPDPHGLGATFEVRDEVPFGRKPMRAWLRSHGYGDVVVKKRGVNIVPEQLRAGLRLDGDGPTATLVLTRTDSGPLALLVARIDPGSGRGLRPGVHRRPGTPGRGRASRLMRPGRLARPCPRPRRALLVPTGAGVERPG